jgi:glutathione S-transferase
MKLYYNPVSTFSQKVIMGFHEKGQTFDGQVVDLFSPEGAAAYRKVYPLGKVPVLVLSDGWMIPESAIILEYLDTHVEGGTRLLPKDPDQARQARFHERVSDLYLHEPLATVLFDGMKPEAEREPKRVAKAKERLDVMYAMMDKHYAKNTWALGEAFSVADCSAAPPLGYLRGMYSFDRYPNLVAYAGRLAERPSYRKAFEEAAPIVAKMMGR